MISMSGYHLQHRYTQGEFTIFDEMEQDSMRFSQMSRCKYLKFDRLLTSGILCATVDFLTSDNSKHGKLSYSLAPCGSYLF